MKKTEIILFICVIIQTLFIFLDYFGIKPPLNWPFYITKIFDFLVIKIPLIWALISITITALLVRLFSSKKNQTPWVPKDTQKNTSTSKSTKEKRCIDKLNQEEAYVLALFTKADGKTLTIQRIKEGLEITEIRVKSTIEKLEEKKFVRLESQPVSFSPHEYGLTKLGRSLIVDSEWDEKLKNLQQLASSGAKRWRA